MEQLDSATRERLASRADEDLAKRSLQGSLIPFLFILLIAIATPYRNDHPAVLWTFGGVLLAVGLFRAYISLLFGKAYPQRPRLWRGLFQAGAYATALTWGTFASLTLAVSNQQETAWFTLLVTTGLASGASVALSPDAALARRYVLILLVPIAALAVLEPGPGRYGVAVVVALYAAFLISQSSNSASWYWRAGVEESKLVSRTRELEERTAYLDSLIRESPLAIVGLDAEQRITMCNPAFERLYQYKQAEVIGRNLDGLIRTEENAEEATWLSQRVMSGATVHATTRRQRKDGSVVDVELHGVPLMQNGKLIGLYALYEDITSRREGEARLQAAHQELQEQVAELNRVTAEINALSEMGTFLQSCVSIAEAFPVVGNSARTLFSGDAGALYVIKNSKDTLDPVASWGALESEPAPFPPQECWAIRTGQAHVYQPGGSQPRCQHVEGSEGLATVCVPLVAQNEARGVLHLRVTGGPAAGGKWLDSRRRLGVAFSEEVALALANLSLRETLQAQSIRDPLTGLFNRRYMEESLEREIRRASRKHSPVSVLMVDVDHFKRFNDTFGHEAGDLLLRELGKLLRQKVRAEDLVCRYGGEEFTLILPDAALADAARRGDALRAAASLLEVRHSGQLLGTITLSIGAACYPEHGDTPSSLVRSADLALYQAKAGGRNRVVMAPMEKSDTLIPAARES